MSATVGSAGLAPSTAEAQTAAMGWGEKAVASWGTDQFGGKYKTNVGKFLLRKIRDIALLPGKAVTLNMGRFQDHYGIGLIQFEAQNPLWTSATEVQEKRDEQQFQRQMIKTDPKHVTFFVRISSTTASSLSIFVSIIC